MKTIKTLLVVSLVGCGQPTETPKETTPQADMQILDMEVGTDSSPADASVESSTTEHQEIWICHNLSSAYHDTLCSEKCFEQEITSRHSAYCWLLKRRECQPPREYEWQQKHCQHFD